MSATKKFAEVSRRESFVAFVKGRGRWTLVAPDGSETRGRDWECVSEFGLVSSAVVVDANGDPLFDRPVYREAPNVNIVAWGRDASGTVKVGVIRQPRPHADDPEKPGDGHPPMVFGQIPMGFLEKIIGKDMIARYESVERGAAREVAEETGAGVVRSIERPATPWHNPNPAFVATWSDLLFVEVDLEKVEALKADRSEPIFSAEYVPIPELLRRIRDGKDEQGAVYRMCTANSAWMVFFACHPELLKV